MPSVCALFLLVMAVEFRITQQILSLCPTINHVSEDLSDKMESSFNCFWLPFPDLYCLLILLLRLTPHTSYLLTATLNGTHSFIKHTEARLLIFAHGTSSHDDYVSCVEPLSHHPTTERRELVASILTFGNLHTNGTTDV